MALIDKYRCAEDYDMPGRILIAAVQAARDVASEAPGSNESRTKKRADLAFRVLNNPGENWQQFIWAVVSSPGIVGPDATDSDIQFTVNAIWDSMAGVYTSERS